MIELINQQTERLFGYTRAEMSGKLVEVLLPERYREGHIRYRQRFFADPVTRPMGSGLDLHGRRKDGSEFSVEVSLAPLRTADGLLAFIAIRDITERRRQEEALERSQMALAQAQNMEAVGQLRGGVAHDFNNLDFCIPLRAAQLQPYYCYFGYNVLSSLTWMYCGHPKRTRFHAATNSQDQRARPLFF